MKADNEFAISIPVYFKSLKKWTYILRKKKKNKREKKKEKNFLQRESNPRTFDTVGLRVFRQINQLYHLS